MTDNDTPVPPADDRLICRECYYEAGLAPIGSATHGTCIVCRKKHCSDMIHYATKDEMRLIMERVSSSYHNPTYDGPRARAKVIKALEARYSGGDLDDHVHELKSREASDINNAGVEAQGHYLLEAGGMQWVIEALLPDDEAPGNLCPHGEPLGECTPCDVAGDLAYDAAREDRR